MHRRTLTRPLLSLLLILPAAVLFFGLDTSSGYSQVSPPPTSVPGLLVSSDQYIRADRLGITFISSAEKEVDAARYRNALLLGAGWNRWPLYWTRVEPTPGVLDWTAYDRVVIDDLRHGLQINAILLGIPDFYRDGNRMAGLHAPIFSDGSDTPGPDKAFNPDNPWVRYVFESVLRYKPGGVLATQQGWRPDQGIRVWEVWNEPDHPPFWSASIMDYARLLKISYIVIKMADPQATVMFGGLLYSTPDNWLARVLAIYENDPLREQYNWYMDAVAIHSYANPWRSGWLTLYVRETLRPYGLSRPIWLNETGVAVWDDYPGPVWARTPDERRLRATAIQQAWFFIQSAVFAWSEGAQVVFFHQLYDDCGDQPAGSNFPPHNGELCFDGSICWGDAFGLYRNAPGSACFSHHPFPNTPRPVAASYRMLAEVFGREPFVNGARVDQPAGARLLVFERPTTREVIRVLWNRTLEPVTVRLPAAGTSAQVYDLEQPYLLLPEADGEYVLALRPAQPDNYPGLEAGDIAAIGGPPVILVERYEGGAFVPAFTGIDTQPASGTPTGPLRPTPGPITTPPARPTVDPSLDTSPPTASVNPLPATSPPTFTVSWGGQDDSGIARYMVWVRVDSGSWQPWLETSATEAEYTGTSGSLYEFAVWAVDLAGNWSTNTDLQPQASTQVE